MCGIAGFLGKFSSECLTVMSDTIAHRGPDDTGEFHDPKTGLGLAHRRLSIIDLSPSGHQPMWDATGTVVIVFNGEIYNYRELRKLLAGEGYRFNSTSDTEVLLNLYLQDGPDFLTKLNGIFAFALWDTRKKHLLLARDGLGVKPLYYTQTSKGFLFASEIKALLKAPGIDKTLNPVAINHYISYLYAPSPNTMLKAVRKLLPGHAFLVGPEGITREWCFYDLPYDQPIEKISIEEACEGLRYYLKQAVKRQMVADVPVGAFLSGGLDSSSVVAYARELSTDGSFPCFTIGFRSEVFQREGLADDLPYAQKVAQHLGVDLHTIWVGSEMAEHFEDMVYQLDEPQADPAALNVLFISQLARQNGIKVLLSGAGGDELFTGYRRHYALSLERWWGRLPRKLRGVMRAASQHAPADKPWGRRLAKAFRYAHLDGDARIAGYFQWIDPSLLHGLNGPLLKENEPEDPAQPCLDALASLPPAVEPINRMLYLDAKFFLTDHNLNYTDKMSMAHGVEARVPLLDPDLMAFAARLPTRFKQSGATGKWIFKKAMEGILPRDVPTDRAHREFPAGPPPPSGQNQHRPASPRTARRDWATGFSRAG